MTDELLGVQKFDLTAATTTAVGGVAKIQNTSGEDLIIDKLVLDITAGSTGVATVDAGVDDGGDVSSDNLIDGANAQTVGLADNYKTAGTNGKNHVKWKKNEYVVITASATVAGLKGSGYLHFFRA